MTAPHAPTHALPHRTPTQLLALARRGLTEAASTRSDGMRYANAHLAALRAAAAVIAVRRTDSDAQFRSAWALLAAVAPEMQQWATHFAATAGRRAAAEAGIPRTVTASEADDMLRSAEQFVTVVEISLGLARQP